MAKVAQRRQTTTPTLKGSQKATIATQIKIQEVASLIVEKGYGRMACLKYCKDKWGLSETQSDRYYSAALIYLRPDNPDEYREALIARNFGVLEELLQRAMETNDTPTALNVVKTMNALLGVGGKQVEFNDKDKDGGEKRIVISFND